MTEEKVEKVVDVISEKVKEPEEKIEKDKFLETENLKPEEKVEKVKDPKKVEENFEKLLLVSGICYTIFYFYNKFVKREYKEYKEYKEEEYEEYEEYEEEEDYSNIVNNINFKIYNIYDRR